MRIQPNMSMQQRGANEKWGEGRNAISASDDTSGIVDNDRGKWNKKFFEQDLLPWKWSFETVEYLVSNQSASRNALPFMFQNWTVNLGEAYSYEYEFI